MDFNAFKDNIYKEFKLNLNGYQEKYIKARIEKLMSFLNMENDYDTFLKTITINRYHYFELLDSLTINYTEFFRDYEMFRLLETQVLPELLKKKNHLKIWSSACSNGAEPYSLAIIMEEIAPGIKYELEATDIDYKMLNKATAGCYTEDQVRNVVLDRLNKYFQKQGYYYFLNKKLLGKVEFKNHDLLTDEYGYGYDLILCRNVTIYFTREAQNMVNKNLSKALNPGGFLFIGSCERILDYNLYGFQISSPCFYRKT